MIQLTSTNMTDRINFITDRGDKGLLQLLVFYGSTADRRNSAA